MVHQHANRVRTCAAAHEHDHNLKASVRVQGALGSLSELRVALIRASEAHLDASGKLSFDMQQTLFDAVVGELPVATWAAAFLALHGASLDAPTRALCEERAAAWRAHDARVDAELRDAALGDVTAGAFRFSCRSPCAFM